MIVDIPRLLEVLGIKATRQGNELWARCPYPGHEKDSKPSWSIAISGERNGLNYCFGCGASGNAVELAMEVLGLSSYGVAADWLRESGLCSDEPMLAALSLVLKPKNRGPDELEVPRGLLHDPKTWPTPAKEYALGRDVRLEQIYRWKIACAVDGELAGRLWIPSYNIGNRLLDWTARTWCSDELKHKCPSGGGLPGSIFGEEHWPGSRSRRSKSTLVVCEGAFDALACERAGSEYVAALAGAAKIDSWRIMKLAGWERLVLALDPDEAGRRAMKSIETMLARMPQVGTVTRLDLPDGMDCDELWRRNPNRLRELIHVRTA